jgi:hypothetical protein
MTGRAAGYCAGSPAPGYANWGPGRGIGFGGGRGRGWQHRHWFNATGMPGWQRAGYTPGEAPGPFAAPMTAAQEAGILEEQAGALREELERLDQRLAALRDEKGSGQQNQGG